MPRIRWKISTRPRARRKSWSPCNAISSATRSPSTTPRLAALDRQKAQKEAERATIGATIAKLEASIGIIQQRVDIRSTLYNKELGSKLVYLETLQLLVEQQHELAVQKNRALEAEAAVAAITETRRQTVAEFRRGLSDELAKAEAKAGGLTQDVAKAEQRIKLQTLAAPVDGVVHFTRYGLLHGHVLGVSHDAITRDKPQDRSNEKAPGAETATSEPKGQELSYAARISLDRTQMQVEDRLVNLSLGMAVTTEIKTGSRTVLSYLLSPVLRYQHDSLRER